MNIGINASFLRKPATGIGQVTTHVIAQLAAMPELHAGHTVFLYVEEPVSLDLPENFHVRVLTPSLYKRDDLIRKVLWEQCLLPRNARKDGCDVLLSLYQCPTVIRSRKMKHVMLVHDLIPTLFPEYLNNIRKRFYQWKTVRAIRTADAVVAVSEYTKLDLMEHLGLAEEDTTVAPIAVDPLFAAEGDNDAVILDHYSLEEGYIYCGGGLEVRKNADSVLQAYAELLGNQRLTTNDQRQESNVREQEIAVPPLVISGKLMPELAPLIVDVEKHAKELGIEEHVKILDFVPQKDLPALYRNALFFCFPSHYEGFGMPILEAMTCGTPVLTSATSSLPEVGGDAVLYCDDRSTNDIAAKMEALIESKDLRDALREKGLVQSQKFSWEKFVKAVWDVLLKC